MNALLPLTCTLLLLVGGVRAQSDEAARPAPSPAAPPALQEPPPAPTALPAPPEPLATPDEVPAPAPASDVEPEPEPEVAPTDLAPGPEPATAPPAPEPEPEPATAPPAPEPEPASEPEPTPAPAPEPPVQAAALPSPVPVEPPAAAPSEAPLPPSIGDEESAVGQALAARLLPRPPRPDFGRALLLLICMLAFMAYASQAERPIRKLRATGLLPTLLKASVLLSRTGALLAAFVGLLHLVPPAWTPAVSYVLVGTALAIGWSVREVVQDVLVGLIFTLEHSFDLGQRLRFEGITGTLTRMTFRVTWLKTDEGAEIAIPNRRLTGAVLELDPQPYTPVEVTLLVPPCRPAVESRRILRELVLLNPYLAPEVEPLVHRQADDPRRWKVTARLVDARFADRFRGSMVDMVEEVFGPADERCATHLRDDRGASD